MIHSQTLLLLVRISKRANGRVHILDQTMIAKSAARRRGVLDFHGDMGQVRETSQSPPVVRGLALASGCDRDDRAEVSGSEPP